MTRRIMAISILGFFLMGIAVPAGADNRAAVPADISGHWAEKEIMQVYSQGLMQGMGENHLGEIIFKPDDRVNQAQLAVVLARVFALNPGDAGSAGDNQEPVWYAAAARTMMEYGIMDNDGKFDPYAPVDRLLVARTINRTFELLEIPVFTTMIWPEYKDVEEVDREGKTAIAFVYNAGIMQGAADYFRPLERITRAELACVLSRTAAILEGIEADVIIGRVNMTETIQAWAEERKDEAGIHQEQFGLYDVYMLAMGEKPTGGYEVVIHDVFSDIDGRMVIEAEYREPDPDEAVITVLTYPYELVAVPQGTVVMINIEPEEIDRGAG